jgi:hypothetical protein
MHIGTTHIYKNKMGSKTHKCTMKKDGERVEEREREIKKKQQQKKGRSGTKKKQTETTNI